MTNSKSGKTVLVTGGTGFVGAHCILRLLEKGYNVKTTLRSLSRKNEVIEMLKNGGAEAVDNPSFIEADLSKDTNWDEAVNNCDYVLHVASPNIVPQLGRIKNASNEKAKTILGWTPRTNEEAILAAVESMVRFGVINKSEK